MSITREIDVVAPNGDIKTYLSWKDRMLYIYITDFLFKKYLIKDDNIIPRHILSDLAYNLMFSIIPDADPEGARNLGEYMTKILFTYGSDYKFIYVDGND